MENKRSKQEVAKDTIMWVMGIVLTAVILVFIFAFSMTVGQ